MIWEGGNKQISDYLKKTSIFNDILNKEVKKREDFKEELKTVTEIKILAYEKIDFVECDGVLADSNFDVLKAVANNFKSKTVWYKFKDDDLRLIREIHDLGLNNVGLALPFTEIENIKAVKESLKSIGLEPLEEIEIGAVIEAPAAANMIESLSEEGVDFLLVDFYKLARLSLGENLNIKNKGFMRILSNIAKVAKYYNIEAGIFGSFDEEMTAMLVNMG
ncbi:MAG: hypothetical protein AABW87_03965, partial [Nanoarchaeota archaeon]